MNEFFKLEDCDLKYMSGDYVLGCIGGKVTGLSLDHANRLLRERGKVVYGQFTKPGNGNTESEWAAGAMYPEIDTHRALLVCIELLEVDSAEKILKEYIDWAESSSIKTTKGPFSWVSRAKALLDNK